MAISPQKRYNAKKKAIGRKAKGIWQELTIKNHPICEGKGVGCTGKTQVGHHFIFKSVCNNLKFDLKNGIGLCVKCHYAIHNTGRAGIVYLNIIKGRSQEWKDYIYEQSKIKVSTTLKWYEEELNKLKKL